MSVNSVGGVKNYLQSLRICLMGVVSVPPPFIFLPLLLFITGQVSTLMKQLNNEKIPSLYNQILLPREVSSERDMDLEVG